LATTGDEGSEEFPSVTNMLLKMPSGAFVALFVVTIHEDPTLG